MIHDADALPVSIVPPFRPRVVVGMPTYGEVEFAAARAMFLLPLAPGDEPIVTAFTGGDSSFLPGSFNNCLVQALNLRDLPDGDPMRSTHFAMIHSDIEPIEPGWLGQLWRVMRETGAMTVSAVSPIKGMDDKVSTAVQPSGDPWAPVRHLTIGDRLTLPDTFGPADVCGPGETLLINTGLWLTDLRHPFWDEFQGFDTRCRIARSADGARRVQWRTEDWEWSRAMAAAGCDYRATWTVGLHHRGTGFWSNY